MLNVKAMLTKLAKRYVTDTFQNAGTSFTTGTPGTYATQETVDISKTGYTPIGILNAAEAHPAAYNARPTISGTTLYIQYYRAQGSAYTIPAKDVTVTILYESV